MSNRPLLELYTTLQEFEGLHERHARTRRTSRSVTVDRQALIHVLMDHSRMIEALRVAGHVEIIDADRPQPSSVLNRGAVG